MLSRSLGDFGENDGRKDREICRGYREIMIKDQRISRYQFKTSLKSGRDMHGATRFITLQFRVSLNPILRISMKNILIHC